MIFRLVLSIAIGSSSLFGDELSNTLAKLDANAASFKAASAQIRYTTHNAVVDVDSTENGTMQLKRSGPHEMTALIEFTGATAHSISLQGTTARIFYPKNKTVQQYEVGKKRDLFDQVFLLGFGGSGKELASAYNVTVVAPDETVGGEKTIHLQLTPKQKEVQGFLKQVDLWLSSATGYPVQQKGIQPSGDSTLLAYAGLKINPKLSDSALKLKLPSGVQTVYPQK